MQCGRADPAAGAEPPATRRAAGGLDGSRSVLADAACRANDLAVPRDDVALVRQDDIPPGPAVDAVPLEVDRLDLVVAGARFDAAAADSGVDLVVAATPGDTIAAGLGPDRVASGTAVQPVGVRTAAEIVAA